MPRTIVPTPLAASYTCPFCDTTSTIKWFGVFQASQVTLSEESNSTERGDEHRNGYYRIISFGKAADNAELNDWAFAECDHCKKLTVWHKDTMVYPQTCPVEPPNPDMPEEVKKCYLEAAEVLSASPRAAAALLRLGLQHLLLQILGQQASGNLYTDIRLYSQKAPIQITKALDTIRIAGNESVHPGTINLNEEPSYAQFLFILMNMICDDSITRPRQLEEAYLRLPEAKRLIKE